MKLYKLCLLVGLMFLVASCNSNNDGNNSNDSIDREGDTASCFTFYLNEDDTYGIKLNSNLNEYPSTVSIPSSYKNKPVTRIRTAAFNGSLVGDIDKVIVPKSIKKIDKFAFSGKSIFTTLEYKGTFNEFNKITFGYDWFYEVESLTIKTNDKEVSTENIEKNSIGLLLRNEIRLESLVLNNENLTIIKGKTYDYDVVKTSEYPCFAFPSLCESFLFKIKSNNDNVSLDYSYKSIVGRTEGNSLISGNKDQYSFSCVLSISSQTYNFDNVTFKSKSFTYDAKMHHLSDPINVPEGTTIVVTKSELSDKVPYIEYNDYAVTPVEVEFDTLGKHSIYLYLFKDGYETKCLTRTLTIKQLTYDESILHDYLSGLSETSEKNHFYFHYLNLEESYNDFRVWLWPEGKDGIFFDWVIDEDIGGAYIDVDLKKTYTNNNERLTFDYEVNFTIPGTFGLGVVYKATISRYWSYDIYTSFAIPSENVLKLATGNGYSYHAFSLYGNSSYISSEPINTL